MADWLTGLLGLAGWLAEQSSSLEFGVSVQYIWHSWPSDLMYDYPKCTRMVMSIAMLVHFEWSSYSRVGHWVIY